MPKYFLIFQMKNPYRHAINEDNDGMLAFDTLAECEQMAQFYKDNAAKYTFRILNETQLRALDRELND